MGIQKTARPPVLIGLYSPIPQQGKTTASGFFQEALSGFGRDAVKARVLSFASPLRFATHAFLEALGLTDTQATKAVWEEKDKPIAPFNVSPRDLMIHLGTTVGRNICGPDVWVNRGMKDASSYMEKGQSVILDDVRATNEADAILRHGGHLVRLVRCGIDEDARRPANPDRLEGLLEGYEFAATIYNNRDKAFLRKSVLRVLQGVHS
jgi:hypothetical protein